MKESRPFRGGAMVRLVVDVATFALLAVVAVRLLFPPSGGKTDGQAALGATGGIADSTLNAVSTTTVSGDSLTLFARGDQPTLTFLFMSTCPACQVTKATWEVLGRNAHLNQVRVLAASPEPTVLGMSFFSPELEKSLNVVMSDGNSGALLRELHAERVPITVLTNGDRVIFHHVGLLAEGDVKALEKAMRETALAPQGGSPLTLSSPRLSQTSHRSKR